MRRARLTSEQLADMIAIGIAEHQTRGLVDIAAGMDDVVIHGRTDLLAVAGDIIERSSYLAGCGRSWAPWFQCRAETRRRSRQEIRWREKLLDKIETSTNTADIAIARMRTRGLS